MDMLTSCSSQAAFCFKITLPRQRRKISGADPYPITNTRTSGTEMQSAIIQPLLVDQTSTFSDLSYTETELDNMMWDKTLSESLDLLEELYDEGMEAYKSGRVYTIG